MFGYLIASTEDLSEEEKSKYQQIYCGLCLSLKSRHGQLTRFSLNYDMTFLILLLGSLYEPLNSQGNQRCIVHPTSRRLYQQNLYTDYAADMTIALTYHKCLDNWRDERNLSHRGYGALISGQYHQVKEHLPRQCAAIEDQLKHLNLIEASRGSPDEAAAAFGSLMGELFIYQEDFWTPALRKFGTALGRFIYWMDAVIDYETDRKQGNYNPVLILGRRPDEMEDALMNLMGQATTIFEKLPLVQDVHLLRSVLYGGIWHPYRTQEKKQNKERNKDGA